MANEPGAAVLSLFDQLIERIKQRTPVRSDDKPLGTMVYSQLVLGMPISKGDYFKPWTPVGGSSLRDSPPPGAPAASSGTTSGGTASPPPVDKNAMQALQAAWKTSMLCRTMLEVTKDGSYKEFPTGRHLDFAYESVITSMRAAAMPDMPADVKARVDAAQKVLYVLDQDGNITGKTQLYQNYLKNSLALATAKANLATQFALAQRDPAKLEVFPVTSEPLNEAVNQARDALISEGGDKVENALDVIGSVGRPMQAHQIKKALEVFDNWNLGLSAIVPGKTAYSLIMPTNWCDADDHDGFETLIVDDAEIQHFSASNSAGTAARSWQQHAQSSSGSGGIAFGFAVFGGTHSESSASGSFQDSSSATFSNLFKNTATGLHIELEYGLCTIERPWLVSDVFYLKGWVAVGQKKNSISDGTIDGQVDSPDKTLPMIPQQFLVIRNVTISATDWGDDGETLSQFYSADQGSSSSSSSSSSAAGGVCLGFVNFGGSASVQDSDAGGQSSSFNSARSTDYFGTTFDGTTLKIPGAQIVAFLSDIVPACPETDDPGLSH